SPARLTALLIAWLEAIGFWTVLGAGIGAEGADSGPQNGVSAGRWWRGGRLGWPPRGSCRGRSPSGGSVSAGRRPLPGARGGRTARDRRSRRPASCHAPPRSGSPRIASGGPSLLRLLFGLAPPGRHLGRAHRADGDGDVPDDELEAALGALDPRRRLLRARRLGAGHAGSAGGRHRARRRRPARPGCAGSVAHHVDGATHGTGEPALTGNVELGSACAASDDHAWLPP